MKLLWPFVAAGALIWMVQIASPSLAAEPKVKVILKYYKVQGKTRNELIEQMQAKGPKGFWAYTSWRIHRSGTCDLDLTITYTLPQLADRARVPLRLRANWDRMIDRLSFHEQGHGDHGREAVRELIETKCQDFQSVVGKWAHQDKVYDKRTEHGLTQGVVLDY